MILSVLNCQEAYAKSLLVPRQQLAEAQAAGDVLGAHHLLTEAYRADVRPLLAHVREALGVPADPLTAYRASGHDQKLAQERGAARGAGSGYPT
jgi:L-rhamnose isomerase/sugar isomerase